MLNEDLLENWLKGVILSREYFGEKKLVLKIFLNDIGILFASIMIGNSGRTHFGGDAEPLNWCRFMLKRSSKIKSYTVSKLENLEDSNLIRRRPEALKIALNWGKDVYKYLGSEQPDNSLLAKLYWNMSLLKKSEIPVEAVNFRFYWQWLALWGIAPDITDFVNKKKFGSEYVTILNQICRYKNEYLINIFENQNFLNIIQNSRDIFVKALSYVKPLLNEK